MSAETTFSRIRTLDSLGGFWPSKLLGTKYPETIIVIHRTDQEPILTLWLRTIPQIMALGVIFGPKQTTLIKQNRSPAVR
jgi:hypothetical protein